MASTSAECSYQNTVEAMQVTSPTKLRVLAVSFILLAAHSAPLELSVNKNDMIKISNQHTESLYIKPLVCDLYLLL